MGICEQLWWSGKMGAAMELTSTGRQCFIDRDGGFTSIGVVVAMTLVVTLLFTSSQIYWINSTSADIQFAADAGALAAENVVGEYLIVARVADAVVLSMSLFGLAIFGVAIVVNCIPSFQEVGLKLMDLGHKVFNARDTCVKQAQLALDDLQKALPFLCVANAATTISANSFSPTATASYYGLAIPLPLSGSEINFPDDSKASESEIEIGEDNKRTAEQTEAAKEALDEMDASKLEGYKADCGGNPNYCMYERAGHLSLLTGIDNPYFASVKLWRFDYAFQRAKAYYHKRLTCEQPLDSSLDEQTRSYARTQLYTYAAEQFELGYAHTDENGVLDASFPELPRNNTELRQTELYTRDLFPKSCDGVLHGSPSCPAYQGAGSAGTGSLEDLEQGQLNTCAQCGFDVNSMGQVANASSVIENGFEYHYRKMVDAAKRYAQASREYDQRIREAKKSASSALDSFSQALESLDGKRFDSKPPGRNGCIAIALDTSRHQMPTLFSNSLVASDTTLSARVAVSAAALAEDDANEGQNLLAAFLDRTTAKMDSGTAFGGTLGVFDNVLSIWGDTLLAYSEGVDGLTRGVGEYLRSIPVVRGTPLANWAEGALEETIESVGLQGVNLSTPKPVLVNSAHVIDVDESGLFSPLGYAKKTYSSLPGSGSGSLVQSAFDGVLLEVEIRGGELLDSEMTLYTIRFGDFPGLPEIPIKVTLPPQVSARGKDLLVNAASSLRAVLGGGGENAIWE